MPCDGTCQIDGCDRPARLHWGLRECVCREHMQVFHPWHSVFDAPAGGTPGGAMPPDRGILNLGSSEGASSAERPG